MTETGLELSVVLPCLNEERTVGVCVTKAVSTMRSLGIEGEVVVVDNGSTDRSREIARAAGARVIEEDLRGYGNALRRGFDEAKGRYLLMADCDDSYDLTDISRFLDALRAGADLVMGNRFRGKIEPGAMKWLHRWIGNPVLSRFLNLLFHTGVGDCHCGMRAFSQAAYQRMDLRMPGMEMASEMVIKSSLAGLHIAEIPITLRRDGRDRPPHLRSFRDGWRHLRFMLMCSPVALFVVPGAALTLAGLSSIPAAILAGYGVFTDVFGPNFMFAGALLSLAGFQLLGFGLLAKVYAHEVDAIFRDRAVERFLVRFSVDRGIVLGAALGVVAALLATPSVLERLRNEPLSSPGLWIFSLTLGLIGIETIFISFLLGIFELRRRTGRTG
jgi:glycosyltransferase involved in cell wall biosynthesis